MAEREAEARSEGEIVQLEILPGAAAKLRVTVVIISAIAIAAALSYLLTGAGTKVFAAQSMLSTLVPDAAGVDVGSEVRLSGIPVGDVTQVRISGLADPQRMVRIDMRVDTQFLKNIPSDSKAIITEDNLLGGQFVSINEGKSTRPIAEHAFLDGVPVQQAADQADLIKALQHELQQADDLFTQMSSPSTPLGNFILTSNEYDQLLQRVAGFNKSMHALVGPDSQLGNALFSEKLYTDIHGRISGADHSLESIQKGEGAAGRLFASDDQYTDLLKSLRDLRKSLADVNAGKTGMLHDDASYGKIRDLLASTDKSIAAFNAGEGRAGHLLQDKQELYDSLNRTLAKMEALMKDLRTNPQKYLRYKL
jgi:phospholipid/cholesterol/gamma-HCH transport system substrate-binding protein